MIANLLGFYHDTASWGSARKGGEPGVKLFSAVAQIVTHGNVLVFEAKGETILSTEIKMASESQMGGRPWRPS